MVSELKIERTAAASLEQDEQICETRPAWRMPKLTRIEIKKTLFFSGSNIDLVSGSTSF